MYLQIEWHISLSIQSLFFECVIEVGYHLMMFVYIHSSRPAEIKRKVYLFFSLQFKNYSTETLVHFNTQSLGLKFCLLPWFFLWCVIIWYVTLAVLTTFPPGTTARRFSEILWTPWNIWAGEQSASSMSFGLCWNWILMHLKIFC